MPGIILHYWHWRFFACQSSFPGWIHAAINLSMDSLDKRALGYFATRFAVCTTFGKAWLGSFVYACPPAPLLTRLSSYCFFCFVLLEKSWEALTFFLKVPCEADSIRFF